MNKAIIFTIILIILAGGLFWGFQSGSEGIILFYGDGCPHCKNVEDFIATNNIDQKVKYTKLEIPFNGKTSPQLVVNADLLTRVAKKCGLNVSNGLIIPFLYDGNNKCFTGDIDTINFFKNATGIK